MKRPGHQLALLALTISLSACALRAGPSDAVDAEASAGPTVEVSRLTRHIGCDETLVAGNPESTEVLVVRLPGVLARARSAGLPYTEQLELGSEEVTVILERGSDLDYWCTDMLVRAPRVDASWTGVAGSVTVTLVERPPGEGRAQSRSSPVSAIVQLGPGALAAEKGEGGVLALPQLEITATLGVPGGG